MSSNWSVTIYRFLMQAYPAEFRSQYGEPVDQAFRDMHRDAFQKRGYLGLALLWFHVVPDFLFSAGEVLLSKAGDFLKWRFRLQWVVACSTGFAIMRCVFLVIGFDFFRDLETRGMPWIILGSIVAMTIRMFGIGLMQSRVLAGRCFRKKQWVLYGLAGAVFAGVVFEPLFRLAAPGLLRMIPGSLGGVPLNTLAVPGIPMMLLGASIGAFQSAAIRNDAMTRFRWTKACALGYFWSAVAGGFTVRSPFDSVLQLIFTSFAAGAVMGLVTSGPLEQILFSTSKEKTSTSE